MASSGEPRWGSAVPWQRAEHHLGAAPRATSLGLSGVVWIGGLCQRLGSSEGNVATAGRVWVDVVHMTLHVLSGRSGLRRLAWHWNHTDTSASWDYTQGLDGWPHLAYELLNKSSLNGWIFKYNRNAPDRPHFFRMRVSVLRGSVWTELWDGFRGLGGVTSPLHAEFSSGNY